MCSLNFGTRLYFALKVKRTDPKLSTHQFKGSFWVRINNDTHIFSIVNIHHISFKSFNIVIRSHDVHYDYQNTVYRNFSASGWSFPRWPYDENLLGPTGPAGGKLHVSGCVG